MKPTTQLNETKNRRDEIGRHSRNANLFPKTDYSYQAASVANMGGRCFSSCRQSFRSISQDYFKNEAPHDFAGEAALFGLIVMTAAWPLFQNANALVHFVRSLGTL